MDYKKINTEPLDGFFSFVSKAVIIIPIFIFVFSLIFKFGQLKTGRINPTPIMNSVCTGQACLTPTPTINKIPIDLIGPWICNYQEGKKQYNLSIKNKNVVLQVKENNQTKKYDLSSYVSYAEGFLDTDITNIENMINQYFGKKINLKEILKSCKKEG